MPSFQQHALQPFGINPASMVAHQAYAARLGLPFPLLSDAGLGVSRRYGAIRPDGAAIARAVVLVGKDGRIRFAKYGAPGAALILEALETR